MKVVSVSHYYPPHTGGLEIVAKKQVQSLIGYGHSVSVITCAGLKEKIGVTCESGITVHRVRVINFFDKYFKIPFPLGGLGLFFRTAREVKRSDIVHIHDVFYMTSWVAYFWARFYKKPIFLTQHVGFVDHPNKIVMLIQKIVYSTIGHSIFNYSTNIIVYNPIVRNFLKKYLYNYRKVIELKNGVDQWQFKPITDLQKREDIKKSFGIPLDKPVVLFVGRFVPKKGFDVLFEARDTDYVIVFAGGKNIPGIIKDSSQAIFLGEVTQEELTHLYPIADVFVCPSKGEIFQLVIQEAMACGVPVITSNEPEYLEYDVDREKLFFIDPQPDILKATIKKVIFNKSLEKEMATYSRYLAQEWFDWSKNVKKIIALYENALKKLVFVTTSWDDGHILDIKLADLLRRYGLAGTFYIAPRNREIEPSQRLSDTQIEDISKDFEIGAHTMTHRILTKIDHKSAYNEIKDSKEYLEKVINQPVTTFCYPRGQYNKTHLKQIKELGFTYARTVKRFSLSSVVSKLEAATTIHTYNHWSDICKLLFFVKFNPFKFARLYLQWDIQAMATFDKVREDGGVFHLWGHSWEIEHNDQWIQLENVFRYISKQRGVQYVENRKL